MLQAWRRAMAVLVAIQVARIAGLQRQHLQSHQQGGKGAVTVLQACRPSE